MVFNHIKKAVFDTPEADQNLRQRALALENRLKDLQIKLTGDLLIRSHFEPISPSITSRVQAVVNGHWTSSTASPTQTHRDDYNIAAEEFSEVLEALRMLIEEDLKQLEADLETAGGPYTPGRVPRWRRE